VLFSRFISQLEEAPRGNHVGIDTLAEIVRLYHFGIGKLEFRWMLNFPGAQMGWFVRKPEDRTSPYEEPFHDAIVYINDLLKGERNLPYRRFVAAKELMHVFDTVDQRADDPQKFRTLLDEIASIPLHEDASAPYEADRQALWKAILSLIPPWVRAQYLDRWNSQAVNASELAALWALPENIVAVAMGHYYEVVKNRYLGVGPRFSAPLPNPQ
jgi:hypothetical protein